MLILASIVLVLVLFVGLKVVRDAQRASTYPAYWASKANEPAAPNALRVVALGDSIMQAIGAAHPDEGIAGRTAAYLEAKTGHPVHLTNVSVERKS